MDNEKTMRAMVIDTMYGGRKATKITDIPYPYCADNQIIIKIKACSICKHCEAFYDGGGSASMVKPQDYPITLGHEFSGEVVEIGRNVHNIKIRDRVTVDNTVLCGECYHCKRDEPLYCDNFGSMGHNLHGGFAEYVVALAEKAFLIPDNISYEEAACTEPVACCMHAMDRMQLRYGDNVAILGAGSMALILAQLVKHSSANHTVVIGSTQSKLDICKNQFGIDTLLMERSNYSIHEEKIKEQFPQGLDIVIDTTGSAEMAKEYVKMGYYIGVGGVVTFKNSRVLKEVVKAIPLECIVVETDCPYLAPAPHRGKRNSSAYLPLVIEEIARLKEITAEEVENVTYENAQRLYGLIH